MAFAEWKYLDSKILSTFTDLPAFTELNIGTTNLSSSGSCSHFSTVNTLSSNGTVLKRNEREYRSEHCVFKRSFNINTDIRRWFCFVWTRVEEMALMQFLYLVCLSSQNQSERNRLKKHLTLISSEMYLFYFYLTKSYLTFFSAFPHVEMRLCKPTSFSTETV